MIENFIKLFCAIFQKNIQYDKKCDKNTSIINNQCLQGNIILLVLNRPIQMKCDFLQFLINQAQIIIATDGAANHLKNIATPNIIIGDFDSFLEQNLYINVKKIKDLDQNTNDFEKCLNHLIQILPQYQNARVFILGNFGGRLDHSIANLSIFQKYSQIFKDSHTIIQMVDENSIATSIMPGQTQYIKSNFESCDGVGLFSINQTPNQLNTIGLYWNIQNNNPQIQFGHFQSSSNKFTNNQITIETDCQLLLTTSLNHYFLFN